MPALIVAQKIKKFLHPTLPQMIDTLRRFVIAESPSLEKACADRCCAIIAAEWRKHGLQVRRIPQKNHGDHLRIVSPSNSSRAAGQAYGPGTFDMKAGIVQALFAHRALHKLDLSSDKRIVFLWTSDEEIG